MPLTQVGQIRVSMRLKTDRPHEQADHTVLLDIADISWWIKWSVFILLVLAGLAAIAYVTGLIAKKRFSRNHAVAFYQIDTPTQLKFLQRKQYDRLVGQLQSMFYLGRRFVTRWLVPWIPESCRIGSIRIVATGKNHVLLDYATVQQFAGRMTIGAAAVRKEAESGKAPVRIGPGDRITVFQSEDMLRKAALPQEVYLYTETSEFIK